MSKIDWKLDREARARRAFKLAREIDTFLPLYKKEIMPTVNLSPHFTLQQLTFSEIAIRRGLDNQPDADTIENLKLLASALEDILRLLKAPLILLSAYRSPKVNSAVGGSIVPPSAHMHGYAADFTAPQFGTPVDICRAIRDSDIKYDQLIMESAWVHFAVDPRMRQMVLTAHFNGGRATYTAGIA